MSTFDGIIQEFPRIQIDYFRKNPERPPPLACFLSHVHSDHLQGLESFRAPFIYCSAATRELLLRIEKYPHRMNFSKGILESRRLHYKHLSKLLRPIPLNTPTEIELTPRLLIRVTLLDANHCAGAVMFLIEGDGKAVLYTGDIRAESWWVNSLIRHPVIIPYTLGNKRLDKLYLDSTLARANHVCRTFPQKAEGLAELLQKVECYPQDTIFYFRAWTFGYEDVWVALSAILNSKVHVDRYQMGLYRSLISCSRGGNNASEAPSLCGFELGNRFVPGCLSEDEKFRIHSCEPGVHCPTISSKNTVYIIPIVSQMKDGSKIPEAGAGGGGGDLYQTHELELPDQSALEQLEKLCLERIHDPETLSQTREALLDAFKSRNKALSLDSYGMKDASDIPLEKLVSILSRGRSGEELWAKYPCSPVIRAKSGVPLPRVIYFPYSRHSSYMELCELVSAFKPKDIYPCTVDPLTWSEDVSMQTLFGHLCSGTEFTHDKHMRDTIGNDDDSCSRKRPRYEGEFSQQSSQRSISMIDSGPRAPIPLVSSGTNQTIDQTTADRARDIQAPESHPTAALSQSLSSIAHQETAYFPRPRMIPSSSLSSSERIPLPSSLETLHEHYHTHTYNEPLDVPKATPGVERAKRNEIRRAWRFLNNTYSEHGHFHLGPLPSSWPTQEEDSFGALDPDPSHQIKEVPRLGKEDKEPEPNSHGTKTPYTIPNSPHEVDMDVDVEINDDNEDELDISTSSQLTNTLSISSSAFASQQQDLELELQDYEQSEQEGEVANHEYDNKSVDPKSTHMDTDATLSLNRSSSSRARRDAYLAAKADSYEAWASIGLLSTGDNHTKQEMEL